VTQVTKGEDMTYLKTIGLASLAAMVLLTTVAVGSASAIVLCRENVGTEGSGECPAGKILPSGTRLHLELAESPMLFENSAGNISCTGSTALGETREEKNATALDGDVETMAFTTCTRPSTGENCTVKATGLNYLFLVLLNGTGKYHVILEEKANGMPKVETQCGLGGTCVFGSTAVLLSVEFLANDIDLIVGQQLEKISGFVCPENIKWRAKYLFRCLQPVGTLVGCYPALKP
jgi:hypothetical protein